MEREISRMSQSIINNILLLFLGLQLIACNKELEIIYNNNKAVKDYAKGKKTETYEGFLQNLSRDPFSPLLQYNASSGFLAMGEAEKAMKNYEGLDAKEGLKEKSPEVYMGTNYNLGVLHGAAKEIEKALLSYQKALSIDPNHQQTKINIELLTQGGKGGGGKDGKDKSDKSDEGKSESQENNKESDGKDRQQQQKQPQNFDQNQMSLEDVRKIMEELKQQEQNIRAKNLRGDQEKKQSSPNGKNW